MVFHNLRLFVILNTGLNSSNPAKEQAGQVDNPWNRFIPLLECQRAGVRDPPPHRHRPGMGLLFDDDIEPGGAGESDVIPIRMDVYLRSLRLTEFCDIHFLISGSSRRSFKV